MKFGRALLLALIGVALGWLALLVASIFTGFIILFFHPIFQLLTAFAGVVALLLTALCARVWKPRGPRAVIFLSAAVTFLLVIWAPIYMFLHSPQREGGSLF